MCLRWKYFHNTLSFILLCLVPVVKQPTTRSVTLHRLHAPNLLSTCSPCIWNPSKAIGRAGTPFWKETFHSDKIKTFTYSETPNHNEIFCFVTRSIFCGLLALQKKSCSVEQNNNETLRIQLFGNPLIILNFLFVTLSIFYQAKSHYQNHMMIQSQNRTTMKQVNYSTETTYHNEL
jgi:hypothetical protein